MYALPVLMLTQDDALWQYWKQIDSTQWMLARGRTFGDMKRWKEQGRHLVVIDAALPKLPAWSSPEWADFTGDMKLLVLSSRPNDEAGRQALTAGCSGYAHAYSTQITLSNILFSLSTGNIWMGRDMLHRLLRDVDSRLPEPNSLLISQLSPREQEVARLAAMGESNASIAQRLSISERTARAHISAIFEKLQVEDRLCLALKVHGIDTRQSA